MLKICLTYFSFAYFSIHFLKLCAYSFFSVLKKKPILSYQWISNTVCWNVRFIHYTNYFQTQCTQYSNNILIFQSWYIQSLKQRIQKPPRNILSKIKTISFNFHSKRGTECLKNPCRNHSTMFQKKKKTGKIPKLNDLKSFTCADYKL